MKRFIVAIAFVAFALALTPQSKSQTICPKNEVLQFGNLFGYSTMICKKDAEGKPTPERSDVLYFFINRVNDMGCGFKADCDKCRTKQVAMRTLGGRANYYAYNHNFNINRENNVNNGVFLDATKDVSRTEGFTFAKATVAGQQEAYFAIFKVSIKYQLPESEDVDYLVCNVALQLAQKPGVSDFLDAEVDKANLKVTQGDEEVEYALVLRDAANQVFLKTPLLKRVDKDPIKAPVITPTKKKPTQGSSKK